MRGFLLPASQAGMLERGQRDGPRASPTSQAVTTLSAPSRPRRARALRVSLSTVATSTSKNNGCAPLRQLYSLFELTGYDDLCRVYDDQLLLVLGSLKSKSRDGFGKSVINVIDRQNCLQTRMDACSS